jgi:hypothetical protein
MQNELAKLISFAKKQDSLELQVGLVLSFTAGTSTVATSAEVDLEGAGVATTCLSLDSYSLGAPAPAVGDSVAVLSAGQISLIIGRIS